jgi:hypothetical protein
MAKRSYSDAQYSHEAASLAEQSTQSVSLVKKDILLVAVSSQPHLSHRF